MSGGIHTIEIALARHGGEDYAVSWVGELEEAGWWGLCGELWHFCGGTCVAGPRILGNGDFDEEID